MSVPFAMLTTSAGLYYFNLLLLQLIKLDTTTKQRMQWQEDGCSASEPVFVARPGATEEDDGK